MENYKRGFVVNRNMLVLMIVALVGAVYLGYIHVPGAIGGGQPAVTQGGACSPPLSVAQTISRTVYNADRPGAAVSVTSEYFLNAAAGQKNPGGTTTIPNTQYQIYSIASGYFATLDTVTTSCTASVLNSGTVKDVDTAITFTPYVVGGRTAMDYATTATGRQALTAGAPSTMEIDLQPSGLYQHLSGKSNQFFVAVNFTNTTDWDTSGFNLVLGSQFASAGGCAPYSGPTPTTLGGQYVYGWTCSGDFTGQDSNLYPVYLTLKPASGYGAGNRSVGVTFIGYDLVNNTITNSITGYGAVKNDGSAIQTAQSTLLFVR